MLSRSGEGLSACAISQECAVPRDPHRFCNANAFENRVFGSLHTMRSLTKSTSPKGRGILRYFTTPSIAFKLASNPSISPSGTMHGPSEGALSGSWWVSAKMPATPTAMAARARGAMNSRWPPEAVPCPPGCWTLWVVSK